MSTSERNAEITRRRQAGERPTDLAKEFGVSPERVWQIVQAEQRHQRGEAPKSRRRNMGPDQAPVHPAIRPRLRLWSDRPAGSEWYECVGAGRMGVGATKLEAYARWQSAGLSTTSATSASTASTAGAGSATVPKSVPAPVVPAAPTLTPVHAGQVQVLPGVTSRKPLRMAATLGLNAERIGAQPPMHSMHGGSRARIGGFHDQE
ncbi:hypothetical protein IB257_25145 [Achromobacter sp. ACM03]|uniref:hypothetical protein n=1 Tax=Achromobacter sp. ACM03 TaxID=2769300 RepID=UPI0017813D01|nr:hypothetical protein [Achromobacter sp. ACM03]MBD9433237.1 hypothetical protein [Achromobacter sp. ACM03]